MPKRSKSSGRWLAEHHADPYVQRAQKEGWRSRAVFKLAQIDKAERLIKPGMTVVDLGAAPGGWSQYAARAVEPGGRVVALDLLPIDPIRGVEILTGDFRDEAVLWRLLEALGGGAVDLVLSDLAPNLAGVDAIDQPRAMHLTELALDVANRVLRPGGTVLAKAFQGAGFQELVTGARRQFATVRLKKPRASRARSAELYLLASGRRIV
jgi:23S rRNA (uridine2552-2'-O)-methyltransferase